MKCQNVDKKVSKFVNTANLFLHYLATRNRDITILLSTCHTVFWRVLFWWFWILSQLIAHVNHLAPNLNHCSETHKFEFHGKRKVYNSGNIDIKNCSNIILNHLSVLYRFINSEFHLFCRAVPWYIYLVIDVLSISTWIKKRKG